MASPPPFNLFTGNGVTASFQYGFAVAGSFSAVIVKVRPIGSENFTTQIEGTHYTHNPATKTITFLTLYIPLTGTLIRVERFTTRDRTVDYNSGSTISERNLDHDCDRLTGVTQEMEVGVNNALRRNDAETAWDAEGLPSENAAPAIRDDGWVTLAQANALIGAGQPTQITEPAVFTFTGDGTTTDFELNTIRGLKRAQADVYIEGVYQSSRAATPVYSIRNQGDTLYPTGGDGDDYISFTTAPTLNAAIEVKVFIGTVLGVLPDEFINDPDQIADDLIGLQHLNVGAGAATRFLVIDANGDPTAQLVGLSEFLATTQVLNATTKAAIVAAVRVNELLAPNGPLGMNSQQITALATPTTGSAAATKAYVDAAMTQIATGTFAGSSLNGVGALISVDVGFQPDLFVFMGRRSSLLQEGSWVWTRGSMSNADIGVMSNFLRFNNVASTTMTIENITGATDFAGTWRWVALAA